MNPTTATPLPDDTYQHAYAFIEVMHMTMRYKTFFDNTGRRIDNVGDLANCLNNGRLDPAALGRRGRQRRETPG